MKIKSYEQAQQELQSILTELQEGAVSVDALSTKVARAQELISYCKTELRKAEKAVQELLEDEE